VQVLPPTLSAVEAAYCLHARGPLDGRDLLVDTTALLAGLGEGAEPLEGALALGVLNGSNAIGPAGAGARERRLVLAGRAGRSGNPCVSR
jgi:hypothetical protein